LNTLQREFGIRWQWEAFTALRIQPLVEHVKFNVLDLCSAPDSELGAPPNIKNEDGFDGSFFSLVAPTVRFTFMDCLFCLVAMQLEGFVLFTSLSLQFLRFIHHSYNLYLYHTFMMLFPTTAAKRGRNHRRSQRQRTNASFPRSRHSLRRRPLREQASADIEVCFDAWQERGLHPDPDVKIGAAVGSNGMAASVDNKPWQC
jgi:hypothetical protein